MRNETTKLLYFLLITFVFSWIFWIPKALITQGIIAPSVITDILSFLNLGAFGPLVGAFCATYMYEGKSGMTTLLKRAVSINFKKKWFIPMLLLMPAITGSALLIAYLLGGTAPDLPLLSSPHLIIYWFIYLLLLSGPLQEEFGWRGYALDKLQSKFSALKSSLLLGLIWALWHMPLNFTEGIGDQYSLVISTIIGSIISLMLLSVLFTWIYNNTGKSILAVMFFHASMNLSTFKLFPVFESEKALPLYTLFILIVVIIIVNVWGKKDLVRSKIS